MPTMTQPEISSRPPIGVIGPSTFLGPTSKQRKYMLPENMAVPKAITLPPDHDDGDGGSRRAFLSIAESESNATACIS